METVNTRVREVRREKKMNQTDFGQYLSLSQNSLSQIESGTRDVTEKIIKLICFQFNVSEKWLRTGEGSMFAETTDDLVSTLCAKYGLDAESQAVLEVFLTLSAGQRTQVIDFARALVAKADAAAEKNRRKLVQDTIEKETDGQQMPEQL